MSKIDFEPNPLNVHNLRVLNHCPPHFYAVDFDLSCPAKQLSDWIYVNLSGRFYFGEVAEGRKLYHRAAFEIHSEASYFALSLSDINKFLPR